MNMPKTGLIGLLGATIVAAYFAPEPADVVAPSAHGASAAAGAITTAPAPVSEASPEALLRLEPRAAAAELSPMFSPPVPVTPPAPPPVVQATVAAVVVAPPAPPQAPPLPFKPFGRYIDQGRPAVFALYNDRNIILRTGERLDEQYLVEAIDDRSVTFLYLPLQQRQTLDLGTLP